MSHLSLPSARRNVLALVAAVLLTFGLLSAPQATADSQVPAVAATRVQHWAAPGKAKITPGVMMYTAGAQCTSNFVFTDAQGRVYVGYAAHCAGLGKATDTNGCDSTSLPLHSKVTFSEGGSLVSGGTRLGGGRLVYSSWRTMKKLGTKSANPCAYNDLALVKVNKSDVRKVNPSVPFFGGPTGLDTNGTARGDRLYTYGNSSLRAGISVLSPHFGFSLGDAASDGGWSHPLYSLTPGIPGDSGSGFLSGHGKAIGVLSTIGLAPLPLSNNIGDLAKELRFARQHSGIKGLRLTKGTEPFSSGF